MAINYSELVKSLIEEQAKIQQSSEISLEIIFEDLRKHYLLVQVGWHNNHWIYGCLLHYDDKSYSLTDCISFAIMKRLNINNSLTFDKHFSQAKFTKLP
jgi:predicted nucleic acid-binding protein